MSAHDKRYEKAHEYLDLCYSYVFPISPVVTNFLVTRSDNLTDFGKALGRTRQRSSIARQKLLMTLPRFTRLLSRVTTTRRQHSHPVIQVLSAHRSYSRLVSLRLARLSQRRMQRPSSSAVVSHQTQLRTLKRSEQLPPRMDAIPITSRFSLR